MTVLSDADFAAAWASEKPKHISTGVASRSKNKSDIKIAVDYLGIDTELRSAASIAADIWDRLRKPSMIHIWQTNLRMYRLCVLAAKWYDNRSMIAKPR